MNGRLDDRLERVSLHEGPVGLRRHDEPARHREAGARQAGQVEALAAGRLQHGVGTVERQNENGYHK